MSLFRPNPKKKLSFLYNGALHVFLLGKTTNKKIAFPNQVILQHFAFSTDQHRAAHESKGWKQLFEDGRDDAVCLDCPLKGIHGGCYTHKPLQASGFLATLRSIGLDAPEPFSEEDHAQVVLWAKERYVRFGTYGEPSLLPFGLINDVCSVAKSWTSYTHQWRKYPLMATWFMASCSSEQEAIQARDNGFRSFTNFDAGTIINRDRFTVCPASAERDHAAVCSTCGLCAGMAHRKKKDIAIYTH